MPRIRRLAVNTLTVGRSFWRYSSPRVVPEHKTPSTRESASMRPTVPGDQPATVTQTGLTLWVRVAPGVHSYQSIMSVDLECDASGRSDDRRPRRVQIIAGRSGIVDGSLRAEAPRIEPEEHHGHANSSGSAPPATNGGLDGLEPRLVVLMIGTSNIGNANKMSVGETVAGIRCVVEAIRRKCPEAKLLLLGIFPRAAEPGHRLRGTTSAINAQLATLDDGGKTIRYLDVGPRFLDPAGNLPREIRPDARRPNARGYEIWAEAMGPVVDEMSK